MSIHQWTLDTADIAIPPLKSPIDWKHVKIYECGEKLVPLSALDQQRIIVDPEYYKAGYQHALEECYARETVARMLHTAAKTLPERWKIVLFDVWRPLLLQKQLFDEYRAKLRIQHPQAEDHELDEKTQRYVSLPSSDPAHPSPHATGGALDLSLRDETGKNLEMGAGFDIFDDRCHTRYYEVQVEQKGKLAPQEEVWLRNRRILFHALTRVGFTNYPEEWWHFDYGNQFWARIKGVEAIYGIASLSPQ
jgi:D-alanyl-D-alanine dipeptidase